MAIDVKSLIPVINLAIDAAQSSLIDEDKVLLQNAVDALQNLVVLAFDEVDNKEQAEALGADLLALVAKYKGEVATDEVVA